MDCKVVLGTKMSTQHRLLVLVFRMKKKIVEKKVEFRGKIMWGKIQRGYGHNPIKLDTKEGKSKFLSWQGLGPGSEKT